MKKKLLMAILICLGIAGAASAIEVINIDLNVDGDANAYTGTAAVQSEPGYDFPDIWWAYYGGWGKAMGSPRSADLRGSNEPCLPSTYAAQVWIGNGDGDNGNHETYRDVNISNLLMRDGFRKKDAATADPNICLFGWDAYTGKFDIYVYGTEAGDFNLAICDVNIWWEPNNVGAPDANIHPADGNTYKLHNESKWTSTKKSVSGGFTGTFTENTNYVKFTDVNVNPSYRGTIVATDANTDANTVPLTGHRVYIVYTKRINGLQLVSTKRPVAVYNAKKIEARAYDVAFETNARSGEGQHFGPDIAPADVYSTYGYVVYLDGGEYMEYDITVNDVNEGEYNIFAYVRTSLYDANYLTFYLDDMPLGAPIADYTGELYLVPTTKVSVNIFEGSHVFKWFLSRTYYFDIAAFEFERIGDISMPDCNAVYKYGFNYTGDLNHDCSVDYKDLDVITDQWLNCYDPDPNICP
jgi:hypothetical protein